MTRNAKRSGANSAAGHVTGYQTQQKTIERANVTEAKQLRSSVAKVQDTPSVFTNSKARARCNSVTNRKVDITSRLSSSSGAPTNSQVRARCNSATSRKADGTRASTNITSDRVRARSCSMTNREYVYTFTPGDSTEAKQLRSSVANVQDTPSVFTNSKARARCNSVTNRKVDIISRLSSSSGAPTNITSDRARARSCSMTNREYVYTFTPGDSRNSSVRAHCTIRKIQDVPRATMYTHTAVREQKLMRFTRRRNRIIMYCLLTVIAFLGCMRFASTQQAADRRRLQRELIKCPRCEGSGKTGRFKRKCKRCDGARTIPGPGTDTCGNTHIKCQRRDCNKYIALGNDLVAEVLGRSRPQPLHDALPLLYKYCSLKCLPKEHISFPSSNGRIQFGKQIKKFQETSDKLKEQLKKHSVNLCTSCGQCKECHQCICKEPESPKSIRSNGGDMSDDDDQSVRSKMAPEYEEGDPLIYFVREKGHNWELPGKGYIVKKYSAWDYEIIFPEGLVNKNRKGPTTTTSRRWNPTENDKATFIVIKCVMCKWDSEEPSANGQWDGKSKYKIRERCADHKILQGLRRRLESDVCSRRRGPAHLERLLEEIQEPSVELSHEDKQP